MIQKPSAGIRKLPAIQRNIPDQKASMILFLASPIPTISPSGWASFSSPISSPWSTVVWWTVPPHNGLQKTINLNKLHHSSKQEIEFNNVLK